MLGRKSVAKFKDELHTIELEREDKARDMLSADEEAREAVKNALRHKKDVLGMDIEYAKTAIKLLEAQEREL